MKIQNLIFHVLAGLFCAEAAHAAEIRKQSLGPVAVDQMAAKLGLGAGHTFVARQSIGTVQGMRVTRMEQHYQGIPVYGRGIAVKQDASGKVLSANGSLLHGVRADLSSVTPSLSRDQALSVLRASQGLVPIAGRQPRRETAHLYIYRDRTGRARLSYRASYVIDSPKVSQPVAFIDAHTGELLDQWEGVAKASVPGPVKHVSLASGPGGNAKTGKYHYGTDHPPLAVMQAGNTCTLRNNYVLAYDLSRAIDERGTLRSFVCPVSDEPDVNGAYAPINDAFHFAGVVRDMYQSWFGAPPLGEAIRLRVHDSTQSSAYWSDDSVYIGDGDDEHHPFVSLDVIAHEISHGYTERTSSLFAAGGQSGGMSEAFADMAGEAAEFFDRGSNDFLVGAEVVKSQAGALRDMCDPTRIGASIDNAANYHDRLDEHDASGVYDKAFCLLAKTTGWNTRKAFEVFHAANTVYWTYDSTFDEGACGVEMAADDKGYAKADVTAAFTQVGVRCLADGQSGVVQLRNGVPIHDLSGNRDTALKYTVAIPANAANARITLSSAAGYGDADLYVKYGAAPAQSSHDCHSSSLDNNEICRLRVTGGGVYHVLVLGFSYFSRVTLEANWDYVRDEF